jgi:hypothetical protein
LKKNVIRIIDIYFIAILKSLIFRFDEKFSLFLKKKNLIVKNF